MPTTSTTPISSSQVSTPPIAYSPVTGQSDISLDLPTTAPSSSSVEATVAPSPVTQHTQSSLDLPDKPTQDGHHGGNNDGPPETSSALTLGYPATGHSQGSLQVPGTTTRPSHTFKTPVMQHTQPSLDVPDIPTGDGHHGHDSGPSESSTPPIAYSPATGHSQASLSMPPTTTLAPIVVTAHSQPKLQVPTGHPGGDDNGLVATISLPPEHGHGQGHGRPVPQGQHNSDEEPQQDANPGGIIASLAHEHGQEWRGHGQDDGEDAGKQTTEPSPAQGPTYHVAGTQIVAGASAATVDGTTYSLAPSGKGIFVNGRKTAFSGPAATDSVAMAVMSALGGKTGETEENASGRSSSTMATVTSAGSSAGRVSATSGGVAEQTGNTAATVNVLPGVGLGGMALVIALL